MKNVLLLTANIGGGHNAAANALKSYAKKNNYNINISVVDYLEYIDPQLSKLSSTTYEVCAKNIPQLYKVLYNANNTSIKKDIIFSRPLFNFKSKALINEYKPDIVICNHPFIVPEIINTRSTNKFTYSVFVLMTDLDFHEGWVYPGVDRYIVSNNFMHIKLLQKDIPNDKICCYGIPTSYKFVEEKDKTQARKELNLRDMTTVLLIGGSFGAGKIQKVFKQIASSKLDIQIVVIAGKDVSLKNDLLKVSNMYDKPIKILGYTNQMSLYMDAVDILITKPGGLTITEAMIKCVPMIIINPIPGQEEENADFLLNKGISVLANNKNISLVLMDLLKDKERIQDMKQNSARYAKPNACKDILNLIINYKGELCG